MGPGVQPKRTKIRKCYESISYAPSKQQHERCHKGKWATGSKQKAKAYLRRETSYQDIVSHSQRFAILRITITSGWRQAPTLVLWQWKEKGARARIPSQLLTARGLVLAGMNRAWARVFSSAFRVSNSLSTFFHSRGFFLVTNGLPRSA